MTTPAISDYLKILGADAAGPADAELVARFVAARDETAFELLVWRHAPLVQRVCLSVLGDHHAAEDAAQAAFLALARKAGSFAGRGSVVGWLYRIARRVSVRMARQQARLPVIVGDPDRLPARSPAPAEDRDTSAVLCEEIDRLPEHYRVPVLLTFFEGLTHAEAARRTGWPIGTVAGRLARAKEMLARRLSHRGMGLMVAALPVAAGSFVGATARAAVLVAAGQPAPYISPTVLSLARGATSTMTTTLLKWSAAAALLCTASAGVWALAPAAQPEPQPGGSSSTPEVQPTAARGRPAAEQPKDLTPPESVRRRVSLDNLKQILLAMHNYRDAYGHFPNNITDKDGKPLLSWRVAILPFIEQQNLYKQFKLDESWDSDHNKKWSEMAVKLYMSPGVEPGKTLYKGFAGPDTAFEPGNQLKIAQVPDGTSNTIALVEAGPAVIWTKPEDVPYNPKKAFPTLEGPYKKTLNIAMLDGSVHTIKSDLKDEVMRHLVERQDGIPVDFEATKAVLKLDTKEELVYLAQLQRDNAALTAEISDLLAKRQKLLLKAIGDKRATTADLDTAAAEHARLKRIAEDLKEEIRRMEGGAPRPVRPPSVKKAPDKQ